MGFRKYGRDIKELLNIFNTRTPEGPVYVCTCCQQLWFKHSVFNVDEIYSKTENEKATFITCRTKFVSKNGRVDMQNLQKFNQGGKNPQIVNQE